MKLQDFYLGVLIASMVSTTLSCTTMPKEKPSIKFEIDGKEVSVEEFNRQLWKLSPDSELRLIRTEDGKTAIIRVEQAR